MPTSPPSRHFGGAVVGPVPVQFVSVFSAAIVAGIEQVEAAKRLIGFLPSLGG
jgi:hypothetical protein